MFDLQLAIWLGKGKKPGHYNTSLVYEQYHNSIRQGSIEKGPLFYLLIHTLNSNTFDYYASIRVFIQLFIYQFS